MITSNEQELAAIYGPAAKHADHRVGVRLTYKDADTSGALSSGRILWICAPGELAGRLLPMRYIVAPDVATGFVDVVFSGDIIVAPARTS